MPAPGHAQAVQTDDKDDKPKDYIRMTVEREVSEADATQEHPRQDANKVQKPFCFV